MEIIKVWRTTTKDANRWGWATYQCLARYDGKELGFFYGPNSNGPWAGPFLGRPEVALKDYALKEYSHYEDMLFTFNMAQEGKVEDLASASADSNQQEEEEEKDMAKREEPVTVDRKGTEIILPKDMSYDKAIEWLQRRKVEEDTLIAVHEAVKCYPLEGAYAFQKALAKKYGWADMVPTPGFFGKNPPVMISLDVSPTESVQVPWGRFEVPNVKGYLQTGFEMKDGRFIFVINGQILKKHQTEIKELADLTRHIVLEESLYKAKPLRVSFPENPEEFDPGYQPKFLDVSKVNPKDLIFSENVKAQIATSLFTPVEKTELCRKYGIPLKRGILLEGPYGTGKTLTANAAAKLCTENGWTFMLLETVADLGSALQFAQQYQPCMIFAEDIDRVMEGDRSHEMDEILNTIDGIESKGTEIIVVLTTNHVSNINQAMLRPGRLDAVISVLPPDADAVIKLLNHYGRGLIKQGEDLTQVGEALNGRIPAVIREVVERAKLSALKFNDELELTTRDLLEAAHGMLNHLELLKPREEDNRSDIEKLGSIVGSYIADAVDRYKELHGDIPAATGVKLFPKP